jgi:small subunit ribosomal protein S3e
VGLIGLNFCDEINYKSCFYTKTRKTLKMADTRSRQINKKKKFVADGVFHAELHEFLGRFLADHGYGGMEVRSSEAKTDITIKVVPKEAGTTTDTKDYQRQHNELASLIQKRYGFEEGQVSIKFDPIRNKGQCASAQAEMLKTKLLKGVAVRSAALSIINTVMKFGDAKGCEVIVSGKMRVQRAKCMKYKAGYLISTGQPKNDYIDSAIRHCFFKQGIIGVKVKIMLPTADSSNSKKGGVKKPLPDVVSLPPKNQFLI